MALKGKSAYHDEHLLRTVTDNAAGEGDYGDGALALCVVAGLRLGRAETRNLRSVPEV